MQEQMLPTQVPRFELNINDEQLQNLLRDMQFALDNQNMEMERLKKEVAAKPSEFLVEFLA
jgi:hypothetical protein